MEYIPAIHAAEIGTRYLGRVTWVDEYAASLVLDLTEIAPGRSPRLHALLRFHQTTRREIARQLAPRDPVEAVLIEVVTNPIDSRLVASLPANPQWLTWNDETVRRMARHIRESGETSLLPILADALEDAGCMDVALLEHCREQHEDRERSWAVELLATQK